MSRESSRVRRPSHFFCFFFFPTSPLFVSGWGCRKTNDDVWCIHALVHSPARRIKAARRRVWLKRAAEETEGDARRARTGADEEAPAAALVVVVVLPRTTKTFACINDVIFLFLLSEFLCFFSFSFSLRSLLWAGLVVGGGGMRLCVCDTKEGGVGGKHKRS